MLLAFQVILISSMPNNAAYNETSVFRDTICRRRGIHLIHNGDNRCTVGQSTGSPRTAPITTLLQLLFVFVVKRMVHGLSTDSVLKIETCQPGQHVRPVPSGPSSPGSGAFVGSHATCHSSQKGYSRSWCFSALAFNVCMCQ